MSELTAAEWNERYPNGTPALYAGHALVHAWHAFVVDNTPIDPWIMVRVRQTSWSNGTVTANGAVPLSSITPLATDEQRRTDGWVDPDETRELMATIDRLETDTRIRHRQNTVRVVTERLQSLIDLGDTQAKLRQASVTAARLEADNEHLRTQRDAARARAKKLDSGEEITRLRERIHEVADERQHHYAKLERHRDRLLNELAEVSATAAHLTTERDEARAAIDPEKAFELSDDARWDLWKVSADEWLRQRTRLTAELAEVSATATRQAGELGAARDENTALRLERDELTQTLADTTARALSAETTMIETIEVKEQIRGSRDALLNRLHATARRWPPEWWFHEAHGRHDQPHHEAHRPTDVCVPLVGTRDPFAGIRSRDITFPMLDDEADR